MNSKKTKLMEPNKKERGGLRGGHLAIGIFIVGSLGSPSSKSTYSHRDMYDAAIA